ncbi:MAG: hypothetical protein K1X67_26860 [Fimbriimonadaceae bacterium]|nr:hypothetical protein [Fimbriimonadaceae bacterium]
MLVEGHRAMRVLTNLLGALADVEAPDFHERRRGVPLSSIEAIRSRSSELHSEEQTLWREVEQHLEPYTSPEGEEGWFLTASPRTILPEDAITGPHYHASFHQAVPGLLTAGGLLLTFISILLALFNVYVDGSQGTETVKGTSELINGLSAKFVSSILGLALSILFVLLERKVCERRITNTYDKLMNRLGELLPLLTPMRIQLDLHMYAGRQAVSLSNISSDFVNQFTGVFEKQIAPTFAAGVSEELSQQLQREFRPTMEKMTETLARLMTAIERLEAQKQDSITGELRSLLQSLEASLRTSLDEMGRTFHSSLTSAASEEFAGISGTLQATSQVLQGMNAQFDRLQSALDGVIQETRRTTESQLATGREQVEAMTKLMEGLMIRLNESARSNVDQVTASLTAVVHDLSGKVSGISEEMVKAVTKATADSQQTTHAVVASASQWSESTAKRLESLVGSIEVRSKEFQTAGQTLLAAHEAVRQTLKENQQALSTIQSLTAKLDTLTTGLINIGKVSKEQQDVQLSAANLSSQVTANLKNTIEMTLERQDSLLREYRSTFEKHQTVLSGIDKQIGAVFQVINEGMLKYNSTVEANFRGIVDAANRTIPPMAQALKAETDQLADKLDELSDVLDKGIERLRR